MSRLRLIFLSFLGHWFLRACFRVNRREVVDERFLDDARETGRPILLCCWHGRLLFPVFRLGKLGGHALAGLHEDAEIISRIGERLGWRMLRGSSSRGGTKAYSEILGVLDRGGMLFITPDGPTGPAYEVKGGAVKSAMRSEAILVPVSGQASRRWEVRNWDTFVVPKPFGRSVYVTGAPIDTRDFEDKDALSDALKQGMIKVESEADAWIDR